MFVNFASGKQDFSILRLIALITVKYIIRECCILSAVMCERINGFSKGGTITPSPVKTTFNVDYYL